jgi:hypothetical protein
MIKNLKKKCKVLPGTGVRIRIIEAGDLLKDPRTVKVIGTAGLTATPVVPYVYAPGDGVTLGEAFQYVGSAKFAEFTIVPDSGNIKANSVGAIGFEGYENELMGMIKGVGAPQREWAQDVTNSCSGVIVLVQNREGDWDKLGSKISPVTVAFKFDGGKKAGDTAGAEITIKDASGIIYNTYPDALGMEVLPD